jgi:hypothetical protein
MIDSGRVKAYRRRSDHAVGMIVSKRELAIRHLGKRDTGDEPKVPEFSFSHSLGGGN